MSVPKPMSVLKPVSVLKPSPCQVPIALLEEAKLLIVATDHEGVETRKEVPGLALADDGELSVPFAVPDKMFKLALNLSGWVRVLSDGGRKQQLSQSKALGSLPES